MVVSEDLIRPIDGVKECIDELRAAGMLIACDTGYPKEACDVIYATLADRFGITFDVVADSEVVAGRPTPFLVYDCMSQTNVYPVEAVVKADDIELGLHEGRNSGAWTVGVYASGVHGYERLQKADPDYLIPSVKYLPELIFNQIQSRLMRGDQPGEGLAYDRRMPTSALDGACAPRRSRTTEMVRGRLSAHRREKPAIVDVTQTGPNVTSRPCEDRSWDT